MRFAYLSPDAQQYSFNYSNYAWHGSLEIALISNRGCCALLASNFSRRKTTEKLNCRNLPSLREQDNALPNSSLTLSTHVVRSFAIIAFAKSVLHNPPGNRFYPVNSASANCTCRIFCTLYFERTETSRQLCSAWPIIFMFNLRPLCFSIKFALLHRIIWNIN